MRRPMVRATVGVLGDDDEDAGDDLPGRPLGRLLDLRHGCGDVLGAEPVEDGPVGLLPGQVQHARGAARPGRSAAVARGCEPGGSP